MGWVGLKSVGSENICLLVICTWTDSSLTECTRRMWQSNLGKISNIALCGSVIIFVLTMRFSDDFILTQPLSVNTVSFNRVNRTWSRECESCSPSIVQHARALAATLQTNTRCDYRLCSCRRVPVDRVTARKSEVHRVPQSCPRNGNVNTRRIAVWSLGLHFIFIPVSGSDRHAWLLG